MDIEKEFLSTYELQVIGKQKITSILSIIQNFRQRPEIFSSLLGWIYGDGSFSTEYKMALWGDKYSLTKIAKKVIEVAPLQYKIKEKIGKNSHYLYFIGKDVLAFNRFLYVLGAPKGKKVSQEFYVPDWIMSGSREVKRSFLHAIFSNEMDSPKIHQAMRFRMYKYRALQSKFCKFLEQLIALCSEFGIKTSNIIEFDDESAAILDKEERVCLGFYIKRKSENMLRFYNEISFPYSVYKQEKLENCVLFYLEYVKSRLKSHETYLLAKDLHNQNREFIKISIYLNIPTSTLCGWLYCNKMPLPNYEEVKSIVAKTEVALSSNKSRLL